MEFKKKELSNGLVVIGEVNRFAKSSAVGFFTRTGARDERKEISGVSHFLEHMLFKGTENISADEVNIAFDKTGARFNAFTSEENTVYYAAVLPEYLAEITKLWAELMRPALRDDDFNMEKNVIKEEIAMYKDMPSFDVIDRGRSLHFSSHPCGNSVLGSNESIDDLTAQQMREYFTNRYSPNNMVLAFTGNFDWDEVSSVAQQSCSQWQKQTVERKIEDYKGSLEKGHLEKPNLSCEHICLISPLVSMQDERRFTGSLLAMIVGDSVGSRFFWELVDKALADTASMQFEAMDGTGALYSYIRSSNENAGKVLDIIKNIFEDLHKSGITEDELRKAKNKVLSAIVIKSEVPMGLLLGLGINWVYLNQYRTVQDDIEAIKAVSIEDVNLLIKDYDLRNFTQFSLGQVK